MGKTHRLLKLSSVVVLVVAVSCDSERDGTNGGGGTGGAGGRDDGTGGDAALGGASGSAGTAAGGSDGGTSGTAAGGSSGAAGEGGASGSIGQGGGDVDAGDAGDASASDAAASDASAGAAGDGDPCPNGDECGAELICVGYGVPLPNGESTACRRRCTAEAPPPDCNCLGGGFCEESAGSGGAGGSGGSSSGDGGLDCGEVIVNAGCADADDTTTDFQSGEFQGCLHWRDLGDGQGWIHYETFGGFHYDLTTSLGWVIRTDSGTMTLAQAAEFCDSFSVVGLSDWRLPTIDEARSLAGGCDETAPGGSCPLSDSSCLTSSCGISEECSSCLGNAGPYTPGNYYCRTDTKLCSGFHTTSLCPDCSTPGGNWRYGTINGNFFAGSVDQGLFPVCVMENIPNAVPCRN